MKLDLYEAFLASVIVSDFTLVLQVNINSKSCL